MKVQPNTRPSAFFDNSQSHQPSKEQDEVIEMETKEGVASLPKPLPMIGYRPLDASGVIIEDRLPPSSILVSAKYEATLKLVLNPNQERYYAEGNKLRSDKLQKR